MTDQTNSIPEAPASSCAVPGSRRPSVFQLVVLFGVVLYVGYILSMFGLLRPEVAMGGTLGLSAVFLLGLVAASSSCVAVSGGLLLSSAAAFHQRYARMGPIGPMARMKPVLLFVGGRLASYGLLGGAIGLVGKTLVPSPTVLGLITLVAALYMLVMGLNMLSITPRWLKAITPSIPKSISKKILGAENKEGPLVPLLLGGATFFLPCGFTQALQLYALTTGSFTLSALMLLVFALGTAPSLLALGWASSSLKGATGEWFFRFAGALVVVLGVWNVSNAATIAGFSFKLPTIELSAVAAEDGTIGTDATNDDPNVKLVDGVQLIKMKITGRDPYYLPSDNFTVKAGVPVRLEIEGQGTGCRSVFQIPKYKVSVPLIDPVNVVEFTPNQTGQAVFSCSMGMFRGRLNVI